MQTDTNLFLGLIPAVGMMLVAAATVFYWRRRTHLAFRWFWVGARLWAVAVALKLVSALLANNPLLAFLKHHLPYPLYVLAGGAFLGIQSSLTEIGLTLLAVLLWRQLARDADRGIGIGLGAGAFEAFLLGLFALLAIVVALAGIDGADKIRQGYDTAARTTPVFWLLGPVERVIAILCHASSRALVLLGVVRKRPLAVVGGFLLFTLLDGVAGAALISEKFNEISVWWIELALLPFALASIPILRLCYSNWGIWEKGPTAPLPAGPPDIPTAQ